MPVRCRRLLSRGRLMEVTHLFDCFAHDAIVSMHRYIPAVNRSILRMKNWRKRVVRPEEDATTTLTNERAHQLQFHARTEFSFRRRC